MKRGLIVLVCLMLAFTTQGQMAKKMNGVWGFLKMKNKPYVLRKTPAVVNVQGIDATHSFSYWQGSSFTTWSENGRVKATYSFDHQGSLRESNASISIRKSGLLSWWRIQFSPQRTRPFVVYTIH